MVQTATENEIKFVLISEPAGCINSSSWMYSDNKKAAIFIPSSLISLHCRFFARAEDSVAIKYKDLLIVSCYISPNSRIAVYRKFLDDIEDLILRSRNLRVLLGGDFNALSVHWGATRNNNRGNLLIRSMTSLDLRLVNIGNTPTCIRPLGSSIIDLTWASSNLIGSIGNWRVRDDLESLSDHQYVSFSVDRRDDCFISGRAVPGTRWNFKKLDGEVFVESVIWSTATNPYRFEDDQGDPGIWLDRTLEEACNVSAPRIGARFFKRKAHWWNETLADLRREVIRRKRALTRARRRNFPEETLEDFNRDYKRAKRDLGLAITRAKRSSWTELLSTVDADPWGFPFKLVMKRLNRGANLTEVLERQELDELLGSLFPEDTAPLATDWNRYGFVWNQEWVVTENEICAAMKEKKCPNTAPGPDGVSAVLFRFFPSELIAEMAKCFTDCMRFGIFPINWKRARLVLIPKGFQTPGEALKVRPICLLSEIEKLLERILVNRFRIFMLEDNVADLAANQFGFRKAKSTCDALLCVKELIVNSRSKGYTGLAIGLDIANAFNSIPWRQIRRAILWRKRFPIYLCRMIEAYLSERCIVYTGPEGERCTKSMHAGVPQGSVLGPLLWNLTYDAVLRFTTLRNCTLICYADDTLVYVEAKTILEACELANSQLRRLIPHIEKLGLKIAENKTVLFTKHSLLNVPKIRVSGTLVGIGSQMKYLGVFLDAKLTFEYHFSFVEAKAARILNGLKKLMPNLGGPTQQKRKLFYNVILSVLLYGAPTWHKEFCAYRKFSVV